MKNIDEKNKYFVEEIKNELISKKHRKIYTILRRTFIENLLILASLVTGCVSISAFVSLFGILVGITSSAVGWKISAITAGIKKYKWTIKKKKKNHDKIALLAKTELHNIEVLISKDNVLKEYDDTKEEIKNVKNSTVHQKFDSIYKTIWSYCLKCRNKYIN